MAGRTNLDAVELGHIGANRGNPHTLAALNLSMGSGSSSRGSGSDYRSWAVSSVREDPGLGAPSQQRQIQGPQTDITEFGKDGVRVIIFLARAHFHNDQQK